MFKRILLMGVLLVVQSVYAVSEKVFQKIMDGKAKEIHFEADEIDQGIASKFIETGVVKAEFSSPRLLEFQQYKYPEPVVLQVLVFEQQRKNLGVEDWSTYYSYCRINAWVSFDDGQKRFMFVSNEIVCRRKVHIKEDVDEWRSFKTEIKGTVFDVDFEEGLKVVDHANPKIKAGREMWVAFDGTDSKSGDVSED